VTDPQGPLLAIESATARLGVALRFADGRVLERVSDAPGHHAEQILELIDALLDDGQVTLAGLCGVAVSIGPGSFTSLRVGLATAKGLVFASPLPVVPVPTLEALAFGARRSGDERPIAAVLDARRGELYAAVFEPEGEGLRTILPDGLFGPEELDALLPDDVRIVGEGAALLEELRPRCVESDEATRWPRAASVADLGHARLLAGGAGEPDLAPRYVRRAEAEAKRTASAVEDL
jgi:tRNA threonylcarbamoyladenosine biosynthesis protein TsaB